MHKNTSRTDSMLTIQALGTAQCDYLLNAVLQTEPSCLYSNVSEPWSYCYQLATDRPATFTNIVSAHTCAAPMQTQHRVYASFAVL
jgi:hypothetical protein